MSSTRSPVTFKIDRSGNDETRRRIGEELHKPVLRRFYRRHVKALDVKDMFQCDLIEMQKYAKYNHKQRYILAVVCAFTKYGWVRPLRNKSKEVVTEAMRHILASTDGAHLKPPKLMCMDRGKEFYNRLFKELMDEYCIRRYSVHTNVKACLVERFNRTIKAALFKEFSIRGSYNWVSSGALQKVIDEYNYKRVHRTIGMRPADIIALQKDHPVVEKVRQKLREIHADLQASKEVRNKNAFRVGDHVRITKLKTIFEKGYTANWSTDVYVVNRVNPTSPVTYQLRNKDGNLMAGCWYAEELQKTNFPRTFMVQKILQRGTGERNGQVLCKLVGQLDKDPIWLPIENVI